MKIFVASDESGVFDVAHNSVYTYGGLILFSNEERENLQRKYLSIERDVKIHEDLQASDEAKATVLSNKAKARLFRSLNGTQLFGGGCPPKSGKRKYLCKQKEQTKISRLRIQDFAEKKVSSINSEQPVKCR